MLKKYFVLIGIILVAFGFNENDLDLPEKTEVKEIMTLVCDYELKNTHLADNWQRFRLNSWVPSSFYPGLMAQYRVSEDERYLKMAKLWAEANEYTLASRFRHADDHLCGSTYLDIYEIEKEDYMITPTKEQFDSILAVNTMSGREDWKWADALMGNGHIESPGKQVEPAGQPVYSTTHRPYWQGTDHEGFAII